MLDLSITILESALVRLSFSARASLWKAIHTSMIMIRHITNILAGWIIKTVLKLFALAIFLPVAPDDALCLMAGLTNMSVKRYTLIILIAKPLSIFLYSMALIYGGQYLSGLLG